ncbi:MAG: TonB C-terminal domain-containing protein [Polyangiaceae bacterium]|nr:TonB C-terminal domain-containing protein [Polyangiaceae bacterium]
MGNRPAPAPASSFWVEYPPADMLIAIGAASLLLLLSAIGVKAAASAEARPIIESQREEAIIVPIQAMTIVDLDTPLLKLGGQPDPTRLPDRFIKKGAKPRVEEKAQPSTKAEKTEEAIVPPDIPLADKPLPPPPPNAEVTKQVDSAPAPTQTAVAAANVPEVGHSDGVAGGTETDPLKARAVDLYRARIIAWFAAKFRVSGSGLSADELLKYRVHATVDINNGRTVSSYSLTPSGNATFDNAARNALEGAKGQSLPPPPDGYPDIVQSRISLTFVCKEHRCD